MMEHDTRSAAVPHSGWGGGRHVGAKVSISGGPFNEHLFRDGSGSFNSVIAQISTTWCSSGTSTSRRPRA